MLALGADVIAGFPGERDEDHAATVALLESLPFTSLHVFPYSPRPGTAALRLPNVVDHATIRARASELRAIGERKAALHRGSRVGGGADVVVVRGAEAPAGLTEDYLDVRLDAPAPRGARFRAVLERRDEALFARAADAASGERLAG